MFGYQQKKRTMKIKFLMIGLVGLISVNTVFAQKGELSNAQDQFNKYFNTYKVPALAAPATTAINEAKASIDKASVNEKTATMPLTYAVKGAIYAALAYRDTIPATSTPLFVTAEDALKKAKETDTKHENTKMIDDAYRTLYVIKYYSGVKSYRNAKYDAAYQDFSFMRSVMPDDTNALYLSGLAATNAKMYDEALVSYNKLVTVNYSKNPTIYTDMSFIYLSKKDTSAAIKIIGEGLVKYPADPYLTRREIELNLQTGKAKQVISKIESAIAADPKNKTLYYYGGLAYSAAGMGDKALASYQKAVEIDPNYFEATMNLASEMLKPAITLRNTANKLPGNKQKEYDDDMKKAKEMFASALPVAQKAVNLKPTSYDALYNLRVCYLGVGDTANSAATQKLMDAIK